MKKVLKVIFIFRIFCFFSAEEKSGSRETWRDIFSKNENGRKAAILVILGSHPPSLILPHTPSRICFKVVHSFGVHIKYFNTD